MRNEAPARIPDPSKAAPRKSAPGTKRFWYTSTVMPVTSSVRLTGTDVLVQPRLAPVASHSAIVATKRSRANARKTVLLIVTGHSSPSQRRTQKRHCTATKRHCTATDFRCLGQAAIPSFPPYQQIQMPEYEPPKEADAQAAGVVAPCPADSVSLRKPRGLRPFVRLCEADLA